MGALAAPVLINIYDSDMTHEFVVGSRDQRVQPTPGCLCSSPDAAAEILKERKKIKAKLNMFHSFD